MGSFIQYIIKENKSGFTVVELLVAMSVFVTAVTVISGVFVEAISTQRKTNRLMTVNSDASFVFERISREVRTSYCFKLRGLGSCDGSGYGSKLKFKRKKGGTTKKISYFLEDNKIKRKESGRVNILNSPSVSVDSLCFALEGSQGSNPNASQDPWRIKVAMKAGSEKGDSNYSINLGTSIASRILPTDLPSDTQCNF
ncbi:MAG: PilW family protein [Candidatus Magasanikbacteria bacterium]